MVRPEIEERMEIREGINIEYRIIGRVDGRWVVRAFDRRQRQIGTEIIVNTPSEAWKIFMMLNGYSHEEPVRILERMGRAA